MDGIADKQKFIQRIFDRIQLLCVSQLQLSTPRKLQKKRSAVFETELWRSTASPF